MSAATREPQFRPGQGPLRLGQLHVDDHVLRRRAAPGRQFTDPLCRPLLRLLGASHVDLRRQLGDAGQHRHPGGQAGQRAIALGQAVGGPWARVDLQEPAVHGQAHQGALRLLDLHLAMDDVTDQRSVAVENREGTFRRGQHDRRRAAGEEGLLGCDDLHTEDTFGH